MPRLVAMHRAGVINVRAQKKLVEAGIHTVEDLLWLTSGGCARSGNVTLLLVFLRVFNSLRCFVCCGEGGHDRGGAEGGLNVHYSTLCADSATSKVRPRSAYVSHAGHKSLTQCPLNSDVFQEWKRKDCILATGCQALDHLLSGHFDETSRPIKCASLTDAFDSGGVFTSEMIELAGPTASGKTQICLSLASSVARSGSTRRARQLSGKHTFLFRPCRCGELIRTVCAGTWKEPSRTSTAATRSAPSASREIGGFVFDLTSCSPVDLAAPVQNTRGTRRRKKSRTRS
eukprot:2232278-Rhodomonas_salina.1